MTTDPRGTLDPWYVTGFIEGEGSFTYSRSGTRRQNFGLYFAIKRTGSDSGVLRDVQTFFGVGTIYELGGRSPAVYYRVNALPDLDVLIDHFEHYPLRGAKAASFDVWKEMVRLKRENFRKPPVERLTELASALSAAAPRRRSGPW